MSLLLVYFWLFAALLIGKSIYGASFMFKVRRFLGTPCRGDLEESARFVLFVPLLHEAGIVSELVEHFTALIKRDSTATLVFVTTEREFNDGSTEQNTVTSILSYLRSLDSSARERIVHIHYPRVNKTLAEQLNYALELFSNSLPVCDQERTFYGFYNADSRTKPEVLECIRHMLNQFPERVIFQQSSAFFKNSITFKGPVGWMLCANALRQTRWTFLHEIPRYIKNKMGNISLVHVVTHGLFIRADVLKKVGYFPTDGFGEDLYLGFILRGLGYIVHPIPVLENSDSPSTLGAMFRQKYVWFWGPLGYAYYWNRFRKRFPKEWHQKRLLILGTGFLGVLDALNSAYLAGKHRRICGFSLEI
ncbi:MAG: hypothetical protein UY77_C0034G0018 [Candidatus Uhrbacteria bacterium GW2011_GWA2_53_10]|uniref:Glycosyltransferase 2-like domain-containing protein n=1 Tax=Candidatus Uhrbacteria bacterium GW2011_GWA2_53_10 TaxID=1618980 RepID=A0A0G1XLK8_9BACT|nr:MAG: hypothetical protein UY77_C0034G0018 [Candidatus Uhrbacteria bacterium GW2011_GWA2_53_10]